MKKNFFTIAMFFALMAYGQKDYSVTFDQSKNDAYQLTFSVDNWNLETVTHDEISYEQIVFSQSTATQEKGWAELPFISASVQLPAKKNVDLNIVYSDYQDIQLSRPLLPSRGVIIRNQNPKEIPYEIYPQSIVDRFYPETLAYNEEPFIIRDVRGTSVRVFPFQWNAATQTLRVYNTVTVELVENQSPATNPLLKENLTPLREAIGMYESIFINFEKTRYDLTVADNGDILVITTARDETAAEPYITWKKEMGYNVDKEVVATGTNVKTLIQEKYNANNNLMYVLLVGDWADIKSDYETFGSGWNSLGSGGKDPMLGCVVGSDNFPDISVGRFSAEETTHVTTQVNKTIQYEKTPNMDSGWHESFIGIASNEGPGDDNEIDYTHIQRIYTQRLEPFTYNTHLQNYAPSAYASTLAGHINSGASTIAYCGHGSETSFVTTGFSNSDVDKLTNGTKLPFIVSVACVNGAFHNSYNCFAEEWLRKENGGAIVTWMATINQPWTPPQRGQDYFYDILIGGFAYNQGQYGLPTTEQRTHWGAIAVNAACLMLTESAASDDVATVKTWTTFGDPSIQLRTKQPDIIAYSNDPLLSNIPFETTITQNGTPVEGALVCISKDSKYYKAFTDANGKVAIEQDFTPGEVRLVVTGFNLKTIYETVQCIAPNGPYLQLEGIAVNDENGQLDYSDESVSLNLTVKNIGQDKAENISATITSDDEYITIVTGTATLPFVFVNNSATLENAFGISVPANIPDQHEALFNLVMSDGGDNSWETTFTLVANAPNVVVESILLNGVEDGNFISGEVSEFTINLENKGHSDIVNGRLIASTSNQYVTIPSLPISFENLPAEGSKTISFFVSVSENIPEGETVTINLLFEADFDFTLEESFQTTYSDYCIPGSTSCNSGDKITRFILGDIDNSATTCATNGYSNFTEMKTTLTPGETYTVKVTCGYRNNYVRAWIDFNGDKVFAEDEALFTVVCADADKEYSATFTVPEDVAQGEQRLRIRTKRNSAPDEGPCEKWTYGQTHDYTMEITELYPKVQDVVIELVGNDVNISWKAPEETKMSLVGYTIYRNDVCLTATPINKGEFSFEDSNVAEGSYVYKIYTVYDEGQSLPVCSPLIVMYEAPTGLQVSQEADAIVVEWNATESEAMGYNVYQNDALITPEPIALTELTLTEYESGSHCFTVSAVYSYGESAQTKEECTPSGICGVLEAIPFTIYPNPATESVTIKFEGTYSVELYNMIGQKVYTAEKASELHQISLQNLAKGVYFVTVRDGEKISSQKLIVR